jgi:hypothetical protein
VNGRVIPAARLPRQRRFEPGRASASAIWPDASSNPLIQCNRAATKRLVPGELLAPRKVWPHGQQKDQQKDQQKNLLLAENLSAARRWERRFRRCLSRKSVPALNEIRSSRLNTCRVAKQRLFVLAVQPRLPKLRLGGVGDLLGRAILLALSAAGFGAAYLICLRLLGIRPVRAFAQSEGVPCTHREASIAIRSSIRRRK